MIKCENDADQLCIPRALEVYNFMKRKIFIGIAVLATVTLISGASILAFASPGTTTDPLITLSYLTNIFKPQVLEELAKTEQEASSKFDERITALESYIQSGQGGTVAAPGPADAFTVVTLRRGQTLTCTAGAEIMLRIGTVNGFGAASPALVNTTAGTTLSAGSVLVTNNMYMVTIDGNGVTATADSVRVLVRGNYKIT